MSKILIFIVFLLIGTSINSQNNVIAEYVTFDYYDYKDLEFRSIQIFDKGEDVFNVSVTIEVFQISNLYIDIDYSVGDQAQVKEINEIGNYTFNLEANLIILGFQDISIITGNDTLAATGKYEIIVIEFLSKTISKVEFSFVSTLLLIPFLRVLKRNFN